MSQWLIISVAQFTYNLLDCEIEMNFEAFFLDVRLFEINRKEFYYVVRLLESIK